MWAQLHVVHPCIGRLSDELWSPAPSSLLCFFLNTRHGNALVPNAASAAAAVAAAATAVSPPPPPPQSSAWPLQQRPTLEAETQP